MMTKLAILGSTGSIGTHTLEVVRQFHKHLRVISLSASSNIELLKQQIAEFSPETICVKNQADADLLKRDKKYSSLKIYAGDEGNCQTASLKDVNRVVIATSGLAGINPTLQAINAGKIICLATKEVLVSAGNLIIKEAKKKKVRILPIDSEHSAIFQCLEGRILSEISKIYLTCSGGPFRGKKIRDLKEVTPEIALVHPTWSMGRKISIDSATLMNKGFEVIEAMHLFGVPLGKIKVIVHPQSVIHSAVEFLDGSIIAQLGPSDMRLPIQYALLYPGRRQQNNFRRYTFFDKQSFSANKPNLTFEEPDLVTFKCLTLAMQAAKKGGTACAVLTAANDIAVAAFLEGKLAFVQIPKIIEKTLEGHQIIKNPTIKDILEVDTWSRQTASSLIN